MMNATNSVIATLSVLAPLAGALPTPVAPTLSVAPEPERPVEVGTVKSVDWDNMTFQIQGEGRDDLRTVIWNDSTAFMLDDEKSTAEKVLEQDGKVSVTFNEMGEAATVSRTTE